VGRNAARVLIAAVIAVVVIDHSGRASEVVAIKVRGHYFPAPANIDVNVAIEPADNHHRLVIEADSEAFYRSSEIALEGAADKRLHTVQFKNLPPGQYVLRAELRSRTEVLGQARQELTVTGMGGL
jgi:hypothetical protein